MTELWHMEVSWDDLLFQNFSTDTDLIISLRDRGDSIGGGQAAVDGDSITF